MKLKALEEKRNEAWSAIERMREATKDRDFTEDENSAWDKMNADFDAVVAEIEAEKKRETEFAERRARYERSLDTFPPERRLVVHGGAVPAGAGVRTRVDYDRAFATWFRHQAGVRVSADEVEYAQQAGYPMIPGAEIPLRFRAADPQYETVRDAPYRRDLEVGTASEGGYAVPAGFVYGYEVALKAFGPVRRLATIITTSHGAPVKVPTFNDTANEGTLLDEEADVTASSADPTVGAADLSAYKLSSNMLKVSRELVQDVEFPLAELLGRLLGERIARIQNSYATDGTGSSEPGGFITGGTSAATTASATAITADELITLFFAVDEAYRMGPGCAWQATDTLWAAIRKLKGGDGHYLLQSLDSGAQQMLGKPILANPHMDAATAGKKPIAFGDFSRMYIREVTPLYFLVARELYAGTDQIGFVAHLRAGSALAHSTAVKYLTMHA